MKMPRLFSGEMSLSARLLFWFLAIALIPCLILTGILEYMTSAALESSMKRGLMVISEAKSSAIESFVRARRGDATLSGHLPFVISATAKLTEVLKKETIDSTTYKEAAAPLRRILAYYRDSYGYRNAYLFGVDGKLLVQLVDELDIGSNLKEGPLKDSELADSFDRAKILLQAVFADYQIYPGNKAPISFVASPVFDTQGVNTGVIVLEIGNQELARILEDFNGLGETGEFVVGRLKGDEVTVVSPSRFDPNSAFRTKIRMGSSEMTGLQMAAQGQRSFGEFDDYRGHKVVGVWSYIPSLRWGLVVKQDVSEARSISNRLRIAIGSLLVLTLLPVILVALLVARSITHPIVAAVDAANRVADGDLTTEIKTKARGEAGRLIGAISKMTQDLRSLIGKVQKSSISLMSTATQIAATSRQQEQSVHDYGASTNEAAAAVKEISATGQELLRTMNEVNHVAAETADMASHGQESLAGMDKTMRLLADSTASIGSKLSVISERAANINLVVTTITKVADQTNLLSINAAIEAEKAGEYGLGFLVVAREIRRLADQTAVSTLDIERMVKEMQYSVSAGVMEMDKFSDQVRHGVLEVANISGQLGQIITAVQGLTERFEQVTEGMTVQAQGADQIREAVMHLSDGVNQTITSLREFNQATAQLREAVGGLKEEVSRFRVDPTAN